MIITHLLDLIYQNVQHDVALLVDTVHIDLHDVTRAPNLRPLSSTKRARVLSFINLHKKGKDKGTFVEAGKLLELYIEDQNSFRSKFEQCSGVCVGEREFVFSGQKL